MLLFVLFVVLTVYFNVFIMVYGTSYCAVPYTRDIHDCSVYYECVNGHQLKKHCPTGLVFDLIDATCKWPTQTADCSIPKNDYLQRIIDLLVIHQDTLDNKIFVTSDDIPNPYYKTEYLIKALYRLDFSKSFYVGVNTNVDAGLFNMALFLAQAVEQVMLKLEHCDPSFFTLNHPDLDLENPDLDLENPNLDLENDRRSEIAKCTVEEFEMETRWHHLLEHWIQTIQTPKPGVSFNYIQDLLVLLKQHSSYEINEHFREFIDATSGMLTLGCPNLDCPNIGVVHGADSRRKRSKEILNLLVSRNKDYVYESLLL